MQSRLRTKASRRKYKTALIVCEWVETAKGKGKTSKGHFCCLLCLASHPSHRLTLSVTIESRERWVEMVAKKHMFFSTLCARWQSELIKE